MRNKRILLLVAFILLLIIIPVFFIMVDDSEEMGKMKEKNTQPQNKFKEVNFTLYNTDKTVYWELKARKLDQTGTKKGELKLAPINIKVFRENQDELLYDFQGGKGIYFNNERLLTIEGPIEIARDNYILESDKITWKQEENSIIGKGNVRIKGSSFNLEGDRFEADSVLNCLKVYGNKDSQAYFSWEEK